MNEPQKSPSSSKTKLVLLVLLLGVIGFAGVSAYYLVAKKGQVPVQSSKTIGLENEPELLKIGFITDAHCYSKYNDEKNVWVLNWRCERPMREFAKQMNDDFKPDFVIQGGDFFDGKVDERAIGDFLDLKKIYDTINAPRYHVLGNHETRDLYKNQWLELTGLERAYYYFDIKGYRVFVLDANHSPKPEGIIIDTSPDEKYYPGLIDDVQFAWLRNTFDESKNLRKIIFVHQPPIEKTTVRKPGEPFNLENLRKLRTLFAGNNVVAVFSGHLEEMCNIEVDGIKYFALQGFHKDNSSLDEAHAFKDAGFFYEIEIKEDVMVTGYFIEDKEAEYQKMPINQETAICNNQSVLEY